ncbi:response regulator transcription factor [Peribacillus muralis]|uniref:response regulator n=1 Tax=Peribacillus muralis TaxID=264697 RepID=UPI001F4F05E0|nr:response regulator transcription factor [Peribacillus muralis]MCK2015468.1 response regulator transcription factor [Peribacillus muralis]
MIRIVIAENQEMLLEAISSLLNLEEDIEIVGQASNGEEAVALVHQLRPDVCIMDMEMPVMSGLEAAEVLKAMECKVIMLTTFRRNGHFQQALQANVRGYLLKDNPGDELACSIRRIMDGMRIYSPELMDVASYNNSERESEVQEMSAEGQAAPGVIRTYLSTIKDKMKAPTG